MTAKEILSDRDKMKLRRMLSDEIYGAIPERPTHLSDDFVSEDKHLPQERLC